MPLITCDDIRDLIFILREHGVKSVISRIASGGSKKTSERFSEMDEYGANWWIIPGIQSRLNEKISGNAAISYPEYVINKYLPNRHHLKMLSPGSGACRQEILFAGASGVFDEIVCIDISGKLLGRAKLTVARLGISNMQFIRADVRQYDFPPEYFDVIHFHASLHHFSKLESFLEKIKSSLKNDGYLIIHEYAGPDRLQLTKKQRRAINRILRAEMTDDFKQRRGSGLIKKNVTGPGILRMQWADPSEAAASHQMRSALHRKFSVVEEKELGGNILMPLLKDIAYNFLANDNEATELLDRLFQMEDSFLVNEKSDFIFGVYSKK